MMILDGVLPRPPSRRPYSWLEVTRRVTILKFQYPETGGAWECLKPFGTS